MGERAKVKETVSLYSKVWRLPTYRGIVIRTIVMALASAGFLSLLKLMKSDLPSGLNAFIFYSVLLLITAFLGSGMMYLIIRKKGSPLDTRRTLGAAQFGLLFWFFLGSLGGLIDFLLVTSSIEANLWTAGVALGYLIFAFLVTGLSDHHPLRNFMAAAMPLIIWLFLASALSLTPYELPLLPDFWYFTIPLIFIIDSFAVHYIFKAVSHPFERDLGINGPELLRAFGYDYLVENPEPLESIMTQISVVQDVPVELIVFRGETGLIAIGVILYVHPGPFRDIGSSGLPSKIIEHVKQKHGVQAFILHGSCTHHQNLTNKLDYSIVMSEIDRLIEEAPAHHEISGPHWSDRGKFKVWSIFAGEDVLGITTSAPEFTDDISLEVGREAADEARKSVPSIRYVALSDAHNCIDDDAVSVMPGDPEAKEYIESVRDAISLTIGQPRQKFQAGICQICPPGISAKEGMGPGGVVALVLKTGEKLSALISIDGNNMDPGFREKAQELLRKEGFDNVELTTTDTHLVNAISLSSKGYPPVGNIKPGIVLEAIGEATKNAREALQPARVGFSFGEAKGIRTFGEKGFDTLTQDVTEAYQIAKRVGLITGGLAFLTSLVLSFLF
ncbi:MAG: DUF2070 family protein [Candidatus Thorarchaeota archaeon]